MWHRTAEITSADGGLAIRHAASSGPACRLRAALLRWGGAGRPAAAGARAAIVGLAWEGRDGAALWGWPDEAGQVALRPGTEPPEVCSILPTALSLALAMRRGGVSLGARALVIGDGFTARLAQTVAASLGCRVGIVDADVPLPEATRPDVLVETTGEPRWLDWAMQRCHDGGTIFSVGGALSSGPRDDYWNVHRRALTVHHVPERPVLLPGEEDVVSRGASRLGAAVCGVLPMGQESLQARILPEGTRAQVARERTGWGILLADPA